MRNGIDRKYPDERRVVTVLFVDLSGFTAMVERRDPEEVTEVINRYFDTVASAVEKFGGYVDKFLGDAVMVLFGAPRATEDDPERAVRAALEIVDRVRALDGDLAGDTLERIRVHVGVETGLVVAGYLGSATRMDYTVIGDSVNVAARIQGAAGPDQILVGPNVYQRTKGRFEYVPRGVHPLKGKRHELPLFEPVRFLGGRRAYTAGPLVGRDADLEAMRDALRSAGTGETRVMIVEGPPGIGKTRLATDFLDGLDQGIRVATTSCEPVTAGPLDPIVDLLADLWHLDRLSPDLGNALDGIASQQGLNRPALRDLFELDPGDARYRALPPPSKKARWSTVMARALGETDAKTVAVVDDAQWADATSAELIGALLEERSGTLILLLARPGFAPPWIGHSRVQRLTLQPLTEEATRALVRSLASGAVTGDEEAAIVQRASGNAFFVEELVRAQQVAPGGVAGPAAAHVVPASVQEFIAARIDRLPDTARMMLQTASVIGPRFTAPILETVAGSASLDRELEELVASEFISPGDDPDEYVFRHALTREVAYGTLLLKTRREIHGRVAREIEAAGGQLPGLAHHLAAAGEILEALGHWHTVAQRSIQRSANNYALGTLDLAIDSLDGVADAEKRLEWELRLRTARGAALMALEGPGSDRVEATYTAARELARKTPDVREHFPVVFGLFRFFLLRARLAEGLELADDLMRMAQRFGDVDMMLEAHLAAGTTRFWRGDLHEARLHLDELLQTARWVDDAEHINRYGQDPVSVGLAYLGWLRWLLGDTAGALEAASAATHRTSTLDHPFSNTYSHLGLAMLAQLMDDVATAGRHVAEAKDLAATFEFKYFSAMAALIGAWVDAKEGNPAAAADRFAELLPPFYATGARANETYYGLLYADVCLDAGRFQEGIAAADRSLAAADEIGEVVWVPALLRTRASLHASVDQREAAEADRHRMKDVAEALGAQVFLDEASDPKP
ncbi:MAG: adenylate/guanylate cyclase domain-containing protein [Acidimicrobiia bacterium]